MSAYSRDLAAIGGPLGRYARPQSWRESIWPLVALAMLPLQLGILQKAYCIDHGWLGQDMFWRGCYSDVPIQWQVGHLDAGLAGYLAGDAQVAHPVVTGSVMSLLGGLVPDGSIIAGQRGAFLIWAVVATLLLMTTVWLTAATAPKSLSLAAQVALSPVLIGAAFVSTDLLGAALLAAGLWLWARRQPVAAGVLLGLATMARTYPALAIVVIVLLAVRTRRWAATRRMLLAALAAAAVVCAPFLIANPGAIGAPYAAWAGSPAGLGSPWLLPQLVSSAGQPASAPPVLRQIADVLFSVLGHPLPVAVVTGLSVLGMVLALAAGAVLALSARRRPRLAEVLLVMVVIVLLTGNALPVQSSLWLLPLVALAGLRWRDHLIWAGAEIAYFVAVWLYQGGLATPDRGLPPAWYALFLLIRLAAIAWVGIAAWRQASGREAYEPDPDWAQDPARDAIVDEAAGDFTDAPDRVVAVWR